jgi:hypothetical protein
MKAAGVDQIVGATVTRETVAVSSEVRKLGWTDVKVLTASPGRAGITIEVGKAAVEGLYGIGSWNIPSAAEMAGKDRAWVDSYRRRFKSEPNDSAMIFYDYSDWLLQEVRNTGRDLTVERLTQALQASSFKGIVSYDTQHFSNNHIDPEWIRVEQVVQGQWVGRSDVLDPNKS